MAECRTTAEQHTPPQRRVKGAGKPLPDVAGPGTEARGCETQPRARRHAPRPFHQDRSQDNFNRGALNLMKGGIVYSNFVATVSPRYAWEIMHTDQSRGLGHTLNVHRRKFGRLLAGTSSPGRRPCASRPSRGVVVKGGAVRLKASSAFGAPVAANEARAPAFARRPRCRRAFAPALCTAARPPGARDGAPAPRRGRSPRPRRPRASAAAPRPGSTRSSARSSSIEPKRSAGVTDSPRRSTPSAGAGHRTLEAPAHAPLGHVEHVLVAAAANGRSP